jgi:hypothetical protein
VIRSRHAHHLEEPDPAESKKILEAAGYKLGAGRDRVQWQFGQRLADPVQSVGGAGHLAVPGQRLGRGAPVALTAEVADERDCTLA